MAGTSLFVLIDDIAVLLDDIALMTKVATQKTAGVLGDDLALNAQQVQGMAAARELPVVWAVAKGSLMNKVILVPFAMLLSAFSPQLILPLLMIGGAYLCFEGAEKVWDTFTTSKEEKAAHKAELDALMSGNTDMVEYEKDKIKGAIRTDFILSAEIVVIILSVLATKPFLFQFALLSGISVFITFAVYGLVGAIVKLDDVGFWLRTKKASIWKAMGTIFIHAAPKLMKLLSVVGTLAMFMVGGEFIVHGTPFLHHAIEHMNEGYYLQSALAVGCNSIVGLMVGAIIFACVELVHKLKKSH